MRSLPVLVLFLAALGGLLLLAPRPGAESKKEVTESAGIALHLSTDDFPDPADLPGLSGVTRFQLDIDNLHDNAGSGTVTLHREELRFDEAGFATPIGRHPPMTLPVRLAIVGDLDRDTEDGRLYDVRFEDRRWNKRMRFLRSPDPGWHHKLILQNSGGYQHIDRVFRLHGDRRFIDATPVPKGFSLYGLVRMQNGFSQATIRHSDRGEQFIQFDRNGIILSETGRVGYSTTVKYAEHPIQLRPITVGHQSIGGQLFAIDPLDVDPTVRRHVYPLEKGPWTYNLWLADSNNGSHRLLMKEDGTLRHITTMEVFEREYAVLPESVMASLPPDEMATVKQLYSAFGKNARFRVYDGHVVYAYFDSTKKVPLEQLRAFTQLRELLLWQELDDGDLREVARLQSVRYLLLLGGYSNDGYRILHAMTGLREFWTYHRPDAEQKVQLLRAIPGLRIR